MKPLSDCLLYTFVDGAYLRGRQPREIARQLCEGGSDLLQLRAKTFTPEEIRRLAEEIRAVTRPAGVALVINDHFDAAWDVEAEFCHLGQEDFFEGGYQHVAELAARRPSPVRSRAPQVGLSSHAPAQARRAIAAGAAYIAIGPVYATGTKPGAEPVTLEYVRWAAAHVSLPWFAIGGINLQNLDQVLEAGARRICAVSAILDSGDIRRTCQQFKDRLLSAR
jgi:thiamine-phosphate pyrophosphorylase